LDKFYERSLKEFNEAKFDGKCQDEEHSHEKMEIFQEVKNRPFFT